MRPLRYLILPFFLFVSAFWTSRAGEADSLYTVGAAAYGAGRHDEAIEAFSRIIEATENPTAEMYYNLAGAYFKSGNNARAILNYERAYRLDPADRDTKFNLRLLSSRIEDKIAPSPSAVVKSYVDAVTHLFTLRTWVVLSILSFAVFCALVLLYFLGGRKEQKLGGFYGGIFSILFALFCAVFAFKSDAFIRDVTGAVLTAPVVTMTSSPDASAKEIAVLHSGLKVTVGQRVGDYREITLADGVVGWVPSESLTLINPGF